MNKKVSIGTKPTSRGAPAGVDSWVENRDGANSPEAMKREAFAQGRAVKRLTIDISESLHRAIKSQCAMRGTKIADEVRELLLQKYGNQ